MNTNLTNLNHNTTLTSAFRRTVVTAIAGGMVALAGILPVSAAPTTPAHTTMKKAVAHHKTAKRHHTVTARTTTRHKTTAAAHPKQITIVGYGDHHPYDSNRPANVPRISVTAGHAATASSALKPARGYPNEGHDTGAGGEIRADGTVGPNSGPGLPPVGAPSAVAGGIPSVVAPPIGGDPVLGAPPVVVQQPVVVPNTNAPAAPVTPAGPVVPVIP